MSSDYLGLAESSFGLTLPKLVLKNKYTEYENALLILNLETLEKRRKELSLNFAKSCIKNETLTEFFHEKKNIHSIDLRNTEKYEVFNANTDRMRESSIIDMQNLLNSDYKLKQAQMK